MQIHLWAPGEWPSETLKVANDGTERLTMLLQTRIKAVLLGMLVIAITWTAFILYAVVYRTYAELERNLATEDVWRCVEAIRGEAEYLEGMASDWGAWDDMYRFVQDRNPEFKSIHLNPASMEAASLSLLCVVDQSNSILWCGALDGLTKSPLELQAFSRPSLPQGHPLVGHSQQNTNAARLLRTERGVMLVAFKPIVPGKSPSEPQGTVILGRFFSDRTVQKLIEQTHVRFTAWNPSAESLPHHVASVLSSTQMGKVRIERPDAEADVLEGYAVLPDVFGNPALVIDATVPRTITEKGKMATLQACFWILFAIGVLAAVIAVSIDRHVFWPILRLRRRITSLRPHDGGPARIEVQQHDEIGSLAEAFNTVLDGLTERRKEPRDHSAGGAHREDVRLAKTGV